MRTQDLVHAIAIATALMFSFAVDARAQSEPPVASSSLATAVSSYADLCHQLYGDCKERARLLHAAVVALAAAPTAETLAVARAAWIAARRAYGKTEFARFYGGPIDILDPFLNAWPVDETYIEQAILADAAHHPQLGEMSLLLANERGGEADICTGWHAIEFMLWGQDLRADGAGDRPASDFAAGTPGNERCRLYVQTLTALVVRQLAELHAAWAPRADNYRRAFERDPELALRRILIGALVLTTFELQGERLAVAYETQDQEQEHSCFSDTTHLDLEANQLGVEAIFTRRRAGVAAAGLIEIVRQRSPAAADDLTQRLATTLRCLRAIPTPFDQAMLGRDDALGRCAIRAAIEALDAQSDALAGVGRLFGFDLPIKPRN